MRLHSLWSQPLLLKRDFKVKYCQYFKKRQILMKWLCVFTDGFTHKGFCHLTHTQSHTSKLQLTFLYANILSTVRCQMYTSEVKQWQVRDDFIGDTDSNLKTEHLWRILWGDKVCLMRNSYLPPMLGLTVENITTHLFLSNEPILSDVYRESGL